MAAASDPVVCDGQVEGQAAVPCRVLEIALDFHVGAPLACAGRHLVLRAFIERDGFVERRVRLLKRSHATGPYMKQTNAEAS